MPLPYSIAVGRPDVTATPLPNTLLARFNRDRCASRFAGPSVIIWTGNVRSATLSLNASKLHGEITAQGGAMFRGSVTTTRFKTSARNVARSSNAVLNRSV